MEISRDGPGAYAQARGSVALRNLRFAETLDLSEATMPSSRPRSPRACLTLAGLVLAVTTTACGGFEVPVPAAIDGQPAGENPADLGDAAAVEPGPVPVVDAGPRVPTGTPCLGACQEPIEGPPCTTACGDCPVPVITYGPAASGQPGQPWLLHGNASKPGPGHSILAYSWTLEAPSGPSVDVLPYPTAPEVVILPQLVGQHRVCLDVVDTSGTAACAPACVNLWAESNAWFHAELFWTTAGDPTPTDAGPGAGADLDLHVAHPWAQAKDIDCDTVPDPWFTIPYDTFWFNLQPTWTAPKDANDPIYAVDVRDGRGPETVRMQVAPPGGGYAIGVHYFEGVAADGFSFGPAIATVRVYLDGQFVAHEKRALAPGDFWFVGRIHAPPGNETKPWTRCLQQGDPCSGGKMWSPQGAPCIRPCYGVAGDVPFTKGELPVACKPP